VENGRDTSFYQVPMDFIKKMAVNSLLEGFPVWFGADVSKGYNRIYNILDEELIRTDLLFGCPRGLTKMVSEMSKKSRIIYKDIHCNHAMVLTSVDVSIGISSGNSWEIQTDNEIDKPIDFKNCVVNKWQVENSWGEDKLLTMTDKWFDNNVFEIVVPRHLVEKEDARLLRKKEIKLKPWDDLAKISFLNPN